MGPWAGGLADRRMGEKGLWVGAGGWGMNWQVCKARVWQADGGALFDTARYVSRPAGGRRRAAPKALPEA